MSCPQHTEVYVRGVGWVKKSELIEEVRHTNTPMVNKAYTRELKSRATSVHRTQATEYNEFAKSRGITGVRWDDKGDCYFSSRRSRSEFLKATDRMDMDGGYGDYTGR